MLVLTSPSTPTTADIELKEIPGSGTLPQAPPIEPLGFLTASYNY